jgi:hypothetical protein
MKFRRTVVSHAFLGIMLSFVWAHAQETKPTQITPTAGSQDNTELNTVLMESTFRIEGRNVQNQSAMGTAFVMGRPCPSGTSNMAGKGRYVLITAAHVLQDIQGDTATLYLRQKVNETDWVRLPITVPIRMQGQPLWTKHPDADVAVMYVRLPEAAGIPLLSTDLLADDKMLSEYGIHPGDNLECLGYPFGMESSDAGFPVLRSGKIASFPLLPTARTKTFLLDFLVFKGNSGGPVYMVESTRTYKQSTHLGTIYFIAGIVTEERSFSEQFIGQYSAEMHQYQLGLAVVVHASLIKEAIYMLPSPETLPN